MLISLLSSQIMLGRGSCEKPGAVRSVSLRSPHRPPHLPASLTPTGRTPSRAERLSCVHGAPVYRLQQDTEKQTRKTVRVAADAGSAAPRVGNHFLACDSEEAASVEGPGPPSFLLWGMNGDPTAWRWTRERLFSLLQELSSEAGSGPGLPRPSVWRGFGSVPAAHPPSRLGDTCRISVASLWGPRPRCTTGPACVSAVTQPSARY